MVESDILIVRKTRTTVNVLWQDGSVTKHIPSTEVIPYTNPDEYDCWPGDHVIFKNEDITEPVVVQSVDAADRTALVLRQPPPATSAQSPDSVERVSVLELDPHGPAPMEGDLSDVIGVRRGDFVFIHPRETSNGLPKPHVPKIGEVEEWARDPDPYGWRQEMASVGMEYGQRLEGERVARQNAQMRDQLAPQFRDDKMVWKNPAVALVDWFGEVSSVGLIPPCYFTRTDPPFVVRRIWARKCYSPHRRGHQNQHRTSHHSQRWARCWRRDVDGGT